MIGEAPETLLFLFRCAQLLASADPRVFLATMSAAFVLSGACWWMCTNYSKLWNLRFQTTTVHHVLCGVAATFTLVFTLAYVSLGWARELAQFEIRTWYDGIQRDAEWAQGTYRRVYYTIQEQGRENFDRFPPPGHKDSRVPLNLEQSRATAANIYAASATQHFQQTNPLLSRILWADEAAPSRVVVADIGRWFAANPGRTYEFRDAVDLAARVITRDLDAQTPRVVRLARTAAVLLFLAVQAIPFGVIGWAAYRDLRETV